MRALYLALGRDLSRPDAGSTHTLSIVKALGELGVEVTLAARGAPADAGGAAFLAVTHKPFGSGAARTRSELLESAKAADVIQERAEESGVVGARVAKAAGKPLILEINTPLSGYPNRLLRRVADLNLRRQARAATAVITQTPISRAIIESYTRAPVFVVPNGADPDLFNPGVAPAKVPGAAGGRPVIAFAGSLRPWHGVEDLVAAGRQVLRECPEAFFLVVGGGGREAALKKAAEASLGAANCCFTGAVAPGAVPGYLARADILAAPFAPARDAVRRAQFARHGMWWSPVKIFEYMAMGKPIVASEAGMVGEYLAGVALTYAPGDIDVLSKAILALVGGGAARSTLGAAARERFLGNYTWRHAAEYTVAAWREAIGARRKVFVTP